MDISNIAITGISGRFPNCHNIEEFNQNLLDNKNLLTENHQRWPHKLLGTPQAMGIVPDLDKFDATFFGVNHKQADNFDPKTRKLLEVVFECICDSGTNINDVKGSNTGLYLGVMQSFLEQTDQKWGGKIFNRSIALMANNVSYYFDLKGPSYALDTGCSSSIYGINEAVMAMRLGQIDSAIVCGAQTQLSPNESVDFAKLGVLSSGVCRPFDTNRNGYVKSDAIVAIFLQKKEDSKRIYATILGVDANADGYKEEGLSNPSSTMQTRLFKAIYERNNIDPNEVRYVELHGTGTIVGDKAECDAVEEFFCKNRKEPMLIGSVKSNIGHSESASGLVGIAKMLVAIRIGYIPANINLNEPAKDISGLQSGKLKVVTENTEFKEGLLAVSSFGFGGANGHVVLKPFTKVTLPKPLEHPRLVQVSGRTEEAVNVLLENIENYKDNDNFLNLVDEIFEKPVPNHNYRGYMVLADKTIKEVGKFSTKTRPIWFCFSGMGSQWPGMAKDMMRSDVFKESIRICASALKPYNFDLEKVLLNGDESTYENSINCFTSIVAMAIGLTDVLKSFGIEHDGLFGHSLGEIGCAYADGVLTREEAILAAYARGYASKHSNLQKGMMASIGLSIEELEKILPASIDVASHNSHDNSTIAGPEEVVKKFVEDLQNKNIFARIVNSAHVAYHSRYVHDAGPLLLKILKEVLGKPKLKSKKWLSTSVPEAEWDSERNKFNSPDYHYNNFMNKVYLKQVLDKIPKDAILIEVAPRGLFQAIFRRSLDPDITKISLIQQNDGDNFKFFLSNVGRIYLAGGNPKLTKKDILFPVGINTPSISNLIKWDHSITWSIPRYNSHHTYGNVIEWDLSKKKYSYLFDHIIDGKSLLPVSGFMVLAWESFAYMHGQEKEEVPVIIKNFSVQGILQLVKNAIVKFTINIFKGSGAFEIIHNEKVLAQGHIETLKPDQENFNINFQEKPDDNNIILNKEDFYKMAKLRGYDHDEKFQGISGFDTNSGKFGQVDWLGEWIQFLDGMVLYLICTETEGFFLPVSLAEFAIDPRQHKHMLEKSVPLRYNPLTRTSICGGVRMSQLNGQRFNKKMQISPSLAKYEYVPYLKENSEDLVREMSYVISTVIENNLLSSKFCVAIHNSFDDSNFDEVVRQATPERHFKRLILKKIQAIDGQAVKNVNLLLIKNILKESMGTIKDCMKKGSFILTNLSGLDDENCLRSFVVISTIKIEEDQYAMIKLKEDLPKTHTIIDVDGRDFKWLEDFKKAVTGEEKKYDKIFLISKHKNSGIVGFFNCLREEYYCQNVRIYLLKDENVEEFSLQSEFYKNQIVKDLTVNILFEGNWTGIRSYTIPNFIKKNVKYAALKKYRKELEWIEESSYNRSLEDEVLVHYANLYRWQLFSSRIKGIGVEYSGLDSNGSKIVGIAPDGSVKTYLEKCPELSWKIPESWSLSQAASIPLPLIMCYYGLMIKEDIKSDDTVLVFYERNYFSYLAVILASTVKANTFLVTKNQASFKDLTTLFPNLHDKILLESSLEEEILCKTKGDGVDLIFNKVNESEADDMVNYLKKNGRILNISLDYKQNQYKTFFIEKMFEKQCKINTITLNEILEDKINSKKLHKDVQKLIDSNLIKTNIYKQNQVVCDNVKDYFQNNINEKSVVVEIPISSNQNKISAIASSYFNPNKVYILIGGTGGLGLELIDWMIKKGAKKIVVNSRNGFTTGYQRFCLNKWRKKGCLVLSSNHTTFLEEGAKDLIEFSMNLGPVGGVFNMALVLADSLSYKITAEQFIKVLQPKLFSAENMDQITRRMCLSLEHFVMFSSISSGQGNAGQCNYGFANSALERLCESRRKDNLPGLAIEWGPIAGVGYLAKMKEEQVILEATPQTIQSCLEAVDYFLQQEATVVRSCVYSFTKEGEEYKTMKTVADSIANLFGIKNLESVDSSTSLVNLGMDSILGFEIRNMLLAEFNVHLNAKEIRTMNFADILEMEKNSK